MKLVLLNPANVAGNATLADSSYQKNPPLSLAVVAGLTSPDDWEVVIQDGLWEPLRFDPTADIVGCTAFTSMAPAAYEALRPYRDAGIPTILGGVHGSFCELEARKYAGSVFVGEAEDAWWQVLTHAKCGLSPVYRGERMECFGRPRYDLLDSRYKLGTIQLARGCAAHGNPKDCNFCSVWKFNGQKVRRDSVENVLHNLSQIKQRIVFAVDDNLGGSTAMLREIVASGIGKRFMGQADMAALHNTSFLTAAKAAGVKLVLVGVEDANHPKNKRTGVDFRQAHEHGIAVLGCFIFGFDQDTRESMLERARFIGECGCDCAQVSILTPLPGTDLYAELSDRIIYRDYPADWARYNFGNLVHVPAGFRCEEEFYETMTECIEIVYDADTMHTMTHRCWETAGTEASGWALNVNANYASIARGCAARWGKSEATV